jgi:hypothetical protein
MVSMIDQIDMTNLADMTNLVNLIWDCPILLIRQLRDSGRQACIRQQIQGQNQK